MNHSADSSAAAFIERSDLMRVAISIMAIALVSSPALASPSCMTQSEARQKFPTAHLWWHGPKRCWDATPPSRRRLSQREKAIEAKKAKAEQETAEKKKPPRTGGGTRWRDAMSRATPADLVDVTVPARAAAGISTVAAPAAPRMDSAPRMDWRERWVEITQRFPPTAASGNSETNRPRPADLAADSSRAVEPLVTPVRVMLMLLVLLLALGAFELLRRPARRS